MGYDAAFVKPPMPSLNEVVGPVDPPMAAETFRSYGSQPIAGPVRV